MIKLTLLAFLIVFGGLQFHARAREAIGADLPTLGQPEHTTRHGVAPLRCVAFGTAIGEPEQPVLAYADAALIDTALDVIAGQLGVRCIMVYSLAGASDYVVQAAAAHDMQVIGIIRLELDPATDDAAIANGIEAAQAFPDTITKLSCGSELRLFHGDAADPVIRRCITSLRAAGVVQPITSIDVWWLWCNQAWPCQASPLAVDVDWIGINVFPWWENLDSRLFSCTSAADAAAFHIARIKDVSAAYPDKDVLLTEFGWPAGPDGYTVTNRTTGEQCGVATEANQRQVITETLRMLDDLQLPGVVFQGFRGADERARGEGPFGGFWGICEGTPPYRCNLP